MARLFISQERLDVWSAEERVSVDGDTMKLIGDGRSFKIVPAVRFMKVSGGDPDAKGVLGKVKTLEVISRDGGEHYMDSVIWGDVAYDVQQGFLGTPLPAGASSPSAGTSGAGAGSKES